MVYGFDWSSWHVSYGIQIKFLFQDKVGELYICFNSLADLCKYAFGIFTESIFTNGFKVFKCTGLRIVYP